MASSEFSSLGLKRIEIISKHLKNLDEKSWERFKKALCRMKPPRGAGIINMEDLRNKSIIVQSIFKCQTEKHGPATVSKALTEIKENQTRINMEKELRVASKPQGTGDKQVKKEVFDIAPISVIRTHDPVLSSEPSAKKIKLEEMDVVSGSSKHKEPTASRKRGHKPVHNTPKQGDASKAVTDLQVQTISSNSDESKSYSVRNSGPPSTQIMGPQDRISHNIQQKGGAGREQEPAKPVVADQQVRRMSSHNAMPNSPALPSSGPPAQQIIGPQDRAVPGFAHNIQQKKMGGSGPAQEPPKPAAASKVVTDVKVRRMSSNGAVPNSSAVPSSITPGKTVIKTHKSSLPRTAHNNQQNKKGGARPEHQPPKTGHNLLYLSG